MALRNPCNLLTMSHAESTLRERSGFGRSADLCSSLGTLAMERYTKCAAAAEPGPPEPETPSHSGSHALVPRPGGATDRGEFGLVYQVAGADSPFGSYHGELVQPDSLSYGEMAGSECPGHSGFDGASWPPDDSAWGYFPPVNVLAARGQGMSSC